MSRTSKKRLDEMTKDQSCMKCCKTFKHKQNLYRHRQSNCGKVGHTVGLFKDKRNRCILKKQ